MSQQYKVYDRIPVIGKSDNAWFPMGPCVGLQIHLMLLQMKEPKKEKLLNSNEETYKTEFQRIPVLSTRYTEVSAKGYLYVQLEPVLLSYHHTT